jgi:hypothetical protein
MGAYWPGASALLTLLDSPWVTAGGPGWWDLSLSGAVAAERRDARSSPWSSAKSFPQSGAVYIEPPLGRLDRSPCSPAPPNRHRGSWRGEDRHSIAGARAQCGRSGVSGVLWGSAIDPRSLDTHQFGLWILGVWAIARRTSGSATELPLRGPPSIRRPCLRWVLWQHRHVHRIAQHLSSSSITCQGTISPLTGEVSTARMGGTATWVLGFGWVAADRWVDLRRLWLVAQ